MGSKGFLEGCSGFQLAGASLTTSWSGQLGAASERHRSGYQRWRRRQPSSARPRIPRLINVQAASGAMTQMTGAFYLRS